ncbi:LexA/Signal peptidase, partial [Aspergillus campestris IBT 28561]
MAPPPPSRQPPPKPSSSFTSTFQPTPKMRVSPKPTQSPNVTPKRNPLLTTFRTYYTTLRTSYTTLPLPFRRTLRTLRILAPLVPIGLFFSEHVSQIMWVRGPSMTPYLNEDYHATHSTSDMVLVNMWPFGGGGWPWQRSRRLERGMVVTFRSPANPSHIAVKRIIGLPGDRITTRTPCVKPSQIVPFNHVWLEGDAADPRHTLDSNSYGPVSISLITGRVAAVVWPRSRWLRW